MKISLKAYSARNGHSYQASGITGFSHIENHVHADYYYYRFTTTIMGNAALTVRYGAFNVLHCLFFMYTSNKVTQPTY